ncbi:MAG TPA: SRPBCC domain-containing protein [Luteibacter sp.]|jgi:uncharacterized protein YndB with AHSA1/START domain|nr:SRPBCC domain-containing protein [Luteibacter sp.]
MTHDAEPLPSIELTRVIDAPAASIYRAWTDPLLIRHWLAEPPYKVERVLTEAHTGGIYRIQVCGTEGHEYAIGGEYLELLPGRLIVMSWDYRSPRAPPSTNAQCVTVRLTELGARRSQLDLRHEGIADPAARERMVRAWTVLLDKLDQMYV